MMDPLPPELGASWLRFTLMTGAIAELRMSSCAHVGFTGMWTLIHLDSATHPEILFATPMCLHMDISTGLTYCTRLLLPYGSAFSGT